MWVIIKKIRHIQAILIYFGGISRSSFCARSFVSEFRKPSLNFLSIRIRERLNTELDE
jgi:hypothetical protein